MVWEESRRLWGIGTPIAIATLSLFAVSSVTTVFVGHLGNLPLAAASIGLSVFSTFSFGFLLGMGSALETLCGQAFGAGQVAMLGVYCSAPWIVLIAASLLMIWYIGMITVLTGHLQDAQIAVDSLGICMNVNGWEGMIFIGLNAAISVRVSNELGSGRPRAAKHAVMVVVGESLLIGLLCMALVLIFRDSFSVIYTTDSELQHAVSRIAGLLGLTMGLPLEEDGRALSRTSTLAATTSSGCPSAISSATSSTMELGVENGLERRGIKFLLALPNFTPLFDFRHVIYMGNAELFTLLISHTLQLQAALASSRVRKWGGADATKPLLE
uniref:Protein TRANSPARENT TESTA 12 n=1 Tax=Aegilops tauschii TaxID=37682 RepID=M8CV32_AEGTA